MIRAGRPAVRLALAVALLLAPVAFTAPAVVIRAGSFVMKEGQGIRR